MRLKCTRYIRDQGHSTEILPIYAIHVMSLKEKSGRFFFHFREIFEKCIEYIGKFLIHFREILNFCVKIGTL